MDPKEVEQLNLNFIKKLKKLNCSIHIDNNYSNICLEPKCENKGLLCGECIFEHHSQHASLCVPIKYFKVHPEENNQKNSIETFEESLINIKEKINSIINDEFEKLADMKKIKSFQDLIKLDNLEGQESALDLFRDFTYLKDREYFIINDDNYKKTIKEKLKNLLENLQTKIDREIKCKSKELFGKEIYPVEKSIIRSLENFSDGWRNNEKLSDFLNFIPKEDLILMGYGRTKYSEKNKFSTEISIYDDNNKTFLYRERIEGDDSNKAEKIFDHIFTDHLNLKKGVRYTIIETNLINNGESFYVNSNSKSSTDFDFTSDYSPADFKSNGTGTGSGKFGYFLVSRSDD